jgi:two-component system chemotaxis response regulator CheY
VPTHALVIDDCLTTRRFLARILLKMGIQATEAANGREALERLQDSGPFAVALVDWRMPEMDGCAFIRVVRDDRRYDALRLMMVTTEAEMTDVAHALRIGHHPRKIGASRNSF